jgi:sugar lactone lactonase YvrE
MPLEKASENAKTSSLFHDISDGIKYVQLTLKKVVQNRQENKNRMKIEEKAIVRNISAFKASVIKTLDELEKSALLELQTVSQDSIGQMVKEETEVNNSVSLIDKHLQQLDFLTKNGSNQHVFRLLHQLLPILSKEHAHLEEMITNHPDVSLVYEQPDHLLSDIKTLGTIRLQKTPCTVRFKPLKHTEAQEVFVQSKTPKSFTFCYRIDRTFGEVTGMVVDKDDNLILADKSFLRMYSQDGKYIKECRLGGDAWDISYHKQSGRIVVALQSNGIQFVDSFTAQKTIIVQNMTNVRGVMWVDDNVYVSGYDRYGSGGEINILDSHGRHISSISSSRGRGIDYIHHRDNNIYYTDFYNEVYCIKKDGSNLFTFSSPDLQGTFGIDTDRPGNLYVVGWRSHNIVRLSPDGQNSDIVLKKVDGIKKPQTLCFSRDFKKLFVSNEDGKRVDVYNCEY